MTTQKKNISYKNKYYGEYTFHYWLWKIYLPNLKKNDWIGFCTYRRFWTLKNCNNKNLSTLKQNIITKKVKEWDNFEVILPKKLSVGKIKKSKILKNFGIKNIFSNFNILFKRQHNLYEHFEIFHGKYHINEAIKLLPKNDRYDFEQYLSSYSFNPHNLFICKNKEILNEFYINIFGWLIKCENKFDMKLLNNYEIRMLGFLAEHFVSYWFQKKFTVYENNITFFDTSSLKLS